MKRRWRKGLSFAVRLGKLAGALCAMRLMTGAQAPERHVLYRICVLLCVGSLLINFGLLFDNERDNILQNTPQIYYGLQRMFFPY